MSGNTKSAFRPSRNSVRAAVRRQALSSFSGSPVNRWRCCFWSSAWKRLASGDRLWSDSRPLVFLADLADQWKGRHPWREINNPCSAARLGLSDCRAPSTPQRRRKLWGSFFDSSTATALDGSHLSRDDKGVMLHRMLSWSPLAVGVTLVRVPRHLALHVESPFETPEGGRRPSLPVDGRRSKAKVYIVASCLLPPIPSLLCSSAFPLYTFLSLRHRENSVFGIKAIRFFAPNLRFTIYRISYCRSERLVRSTVFPFYTTVVISCICSTERKS